MTAWMLARGAGLAALVLLSMSVALGALISARFPARPARRVLMQYAHRVVSSLGLAVLGVHLTAILADSYAHVGTLGALVPFTSTYRATWVGLGSIAAYSFVLIAATGFLRGRMAGSVRAAKVWRTIHGLSYGGWALAMLHGVRSGSDTGAAWVRWLYLGCLVAVLGSAAARALIVPAGPARRSAGLLTSEVSR